MPEFLASQSHWVQVVVSLWNRFLEPFLSTSTNYLFLHGIFELPFLGNAEIWLRYGVVAMKGGEVCLRKIGITLEGNCFRWVTTVFKKGEASLLRQRRGGCFPGKGGSWEFRGSSFPDYLNLFKCSYSKSEGLLHNQYPSHKAVGQDVKSTHVVILQPTQLHLGSNF